MQVLSRATFFSHENDNSCHIKFPTVLMDCNVYAPRTYFFFRCRKSSHRSWGIPLAFLSCSATATHHLNPFYSRIVQQNRHFNMYTKISKRKQGSPCKNFHQRCFETTNFDRLYREELLFVSR